MGGGVISRPARCLYSGELPCLYTGGVIVSIAGVAVFIAGRVVASIAGVAVFIPGKVFVSIAGRGCQLIEGRGAFVYSEKEALTYSEVGIGL